MTVLKRIDTAFSCRVDLFPVNSYSSQFILKSILTHLVNLYAKFCSIRTHLVNSYSFRGQFVLISYSNEYELIKS